LVNVSIKMHAMPIGIGCNGKSLVNKLQYNS
jgi:hypothetical protein